MMNVFDISQLGERSSGDVLPQGTTILHASVVIPLRRRRVHPQKYHHHLHPHRIHKDNNNNHDGNNGGGGNDDESKWKWEVLMGQNHVVNYMRSKSKDSLVIMSYPGEYKFAGGTFDEGDGTMRNTALRELREEFLVDVKNDDFNASLFSIIQTRAVRNRSHIIYQYVCLEDDNLWVKNLDVENINRSLMEREKKCQEMIDDDKGSFWNLPMEERHNISPEIHLIEWLPVDLVADLLNSDTHSFVNDWQRQEFLKYKIEKRDPMFRTIQTLRQIDQCETEADLRERLNFSASIDIFTPGIEPKL